MDNSSDSTFPEEENGDLSNDYAFENTKDKIFLLSARELNQYSDSGLYGWCSDYINANSCYLRQEILPEITLHSPSSNDPNQFVYDYKYDEYYVDDPTFGISPALTIDLENL